MDSSEKAGLKAESSGIQDMNASTNELIGNATNVAATPAAGAMICSAIKMQHAVTQKTLDLLAKLIEKN